jgi:hypothetical protein
MGVDLVGAPVGCAWAWYRIELCQRFQTVIDLHALSTHRMSEYGFEQLLRKKTSRTEIK